MGLDVLGGIGSGLQLLAQGGHEHPQGGDVVLPAVAPDLLGDVGVGEHLAHVLGQQAEQLVLDGREVQLISVQIGAAGGVIDAQAAVDEHRVGVLRAQHGQPPLGDAQPRQQLLHGEGLGEVVVRTAVQRADLVAVLAAGADDDDGHVRPGSNLEDELHAVHVRQAQIQQDHVRIVGGRLKDGLLPRQRLDEAVAVGLERGGNQRAHGLVVLHHQNCILIHATQPPLRAG